MNTKEYGRVRIGLIVNMAIIAIIMMILLLGELHGLSWSSDIIDITKEVIKLVASLIRSG